VVKMTRYEVRRIRLGALGAWLPGLGPEDVLWRGRSIARAKEVAATLAPHEHIGVAIVTLVDGRPVSIDWGDHVEELRGDA
jgi:hypothetical protein